MTMIRIGMLMVTLVVVGCSDPRREQAEGLLEEASRIYRQGKGDQADRTQQALVKVKQALTLAPDFDRARIKYAALLYDRGRFKQALKEVDKVVADGPEKARVQALAAAALFELTGDPLRVDEVVSAIAQADSTLTWENRFRLIASKLCNGPTGAAATAGSGAAKGLDAGIRILAGLAGDEQADIDFKAFYALSLYKARRFKEAIPLLEKVLEDPPSGQEEAYRYMLDICRKR